MKAFFWKSAKHQYSLTHCERVTGNTEVTGAVFPAPGELLQGRLLGSRDVIRLVIIGAPASIREMRENVDAKPPTRLIGQT